MDYTRKSIESVSLSCVSWCVFITVSLLSPPSLMNLTDMRNDCSNTFHMKLTDLTSDNFNNSY